MKKLNIAIFFGGCSSEYKVSLESASAVIRSLDPSRYQLVPVGITQEGDWFYYTGDVSRIQDDTWHSGTDCIPAVLSPSRREHHLLLYRENGAGQVSIEKLPIDIAFPVLHGKNGEDGSIQGAIELAGIPLAGCGILASALCMDKDRAHKLAGAAGIRVPKAVVLKKSSSRKEVDEEADAFAAETGYPVFVKPVKAGSSYGITKVDGPENLQNAVTLAFQYDDQVIIEEAIDGFEAGCAVLGNDVLTVGEADEIELSSGFFDFTEKYTLKTSAIHVPARISPRKADEIKRTAKVIYQTLGCTGFARVDMFLTPEGEIVFNEVNTIPGFTEHSRYPGMMKAAGHSFAEILDKIIELAVKG